jgi:hypothetical protein
VKGYQLIEFSDQRGTLHELESIQPDVLERLRRPLSFDDPLKDKRDIMAGKIYNM